jgi:hypothetical protein
LVVEMMIEVNGNPETVAKVMIFGPDCGDVQVQELKDISEAGL